MIYLDCAATSFPKPESVTREMCRCMKEYCGNPGRGSHSMALAASEALYRCREAATALFGSDSPENAVFSLNATHALNMAIFGLIPRNSHVIISDIEHNSVLRPVVELSRTRGVKYSVFSTDGDIIKNIKKCLTKNTKAIICNHSSNIFNRTLPIEEIGDFCKRLGLIFIVDGSQSAGNTTIDMKCGISALCFPGHKGLLGPEGCGMAIFAEKALPKPFLYGGSGTNSEEITMPDFLPDRLEAGTMSAPCAAGLAEGIKYINSVGVKKIRQHEAALTNILFDRYEKNRRVKIYGGRGGALFLFNVDGYTPQKVGALLNEKGICVRTGLHCSPLAHKTAGTPLGGAVRASVGPFTTERDIIGFIDELDAII